MLRCPVCRQALNSVGRSYRCSQGHSFDVAHSGYVNLLLRSPKGGQHSGDTIASLRGRRRLLERGHYEPLTETLVEIATTLVRHRLNAAVLDVGCGEGYLTGRITSSLQSPIHAQLAWGMDISRNAIDMAARHHPTVRFAVASAFDLPVADSAVGVLTSVFAPRSALEFARVLEPRGILIVVGPGPRHLEELRRIIYANVQPPGRADTFDHPAFTHLRTSRIRFGMHLSGDEVKDLLAMTPYYWRAGAAAKKRLASLHELDVGADFLISIYTRRRAYAVDLNA